jgi:hypothetical protein
MAMSESQSVRALALSILNKKRDSKRDSAWDSSGTVAQKLSQGENPAGTANVEPGQAFNPTVPLSHALGTGTVGQLRKKRDSAWDSSGTVGRIPFAEVLGALDRRCPDYVEAEHWRQCLTGARRFLAAWGDKAAALGWTARELFGLHQPPAKPHPTYSRLSRYDATGLLWLLDGRRVIALTADTAAIESPSGNILTYRKHRKPALGPLGDSLDDFGVCS